MRSLYLDYAATTPLCPAAQEAMLPYLTDRYADPMADHVAGRAADEALHDAACRVAATLGASADELVWTSGATEASNLALRGVIEPRLRAGEPVHLVVSAVDHAAVTGPARFLSRLGADLTVVPVGPDGRVDPDRVASAITDATRLVSVVHADDELGAVQPIAEISTRCREAGVLLHTDAAQSYGKLPTRVDELGVDLMSLSAHKCYGPKGVGALYVRRGVAVEPQVWGDHRQDGQRSGMPNVAGIVGFAAAAEVAFAGRADAALRLADLRDRLAARLIAGGTATVYGPADADRLPGALCVALPGVTGSDLLAATPEVFATPLGCGSLADASVTLSNSLRAIGVDTDRGAGAVRLSVGWYTDAEEVDAAADALLDAWERLH